MAASLLQRSASAALLHAVLLAAAIVRVSALSLVYVAAFFALLLLPLQFSRPAFRIVQFLRGYALLACVAQLAFQIYLGSQRPYARELGHDAILANTLAQIGFVRFDVVWHTVLRFLAPDITVALVAMAVPRPFNPQAYFATQPQGEEGRSRLDALWNTFSEWGVWMLFGTFGLTCTNAAIPNIVFFLVYISLIGAFVFSSLKTWVARCRPAVSALLAVYLAATYVFQLPIVYKAISHSADVLGLVAYVEQNPPSYHASPTLYLNDLPWPLWLLLVAQILTLYFITAPFRRQTQPTTTATRHSLLEPLLGADSERGMASLHRARRGDDAHASAAVAPSTEHLCDFGDDHRQGMGDDERVLHSGTAHIGIRVKEDGEDDEDDDNDEDGDSDSFFYDKADDDGDGQESPVLWDAWTSAMTWLTAAAATALRPVVRVCVNQSWIVTLAAQYTWALAFPSWFGVVMIVWTFLAVYPENPSLYFKSSFVLIAFGGAITLLDLLYFIHPDIISDNDVAEQLGLRPDESHKRITGTLAAKLLFIFVFALTARAFVKTPWFQHHIHSRGRRRRGSGMSGHTEPAVNSAAQARVEHAPSGATAHRAFEDGAGGAASGSAKAQVSVSQRASGGHAVGYHADNDGYGGAAGAGAAGASAVEDTGEGGMAEGDTQESHQDDGDVDGDDGDERKAMAGWKLVLLAAKNGAEDALQFVWDLFLRYAYLITVLIVYVASLNEVTVFNAVYLVILIAFLGFPHLREAYWVWLLLYCTAVILVSYLWGFSVVNVSSSTAESLLGLDPDIHHHIWRNLRWQIAILVLSLVQLLAYRLLSTTRVTATPTPTSSTEAESSQSLFPTTTIAAEAALTSSHTSMSSYRSGGGENEHDLLLPLHTGAAQSAWPAPPHQHAEFDATEGERLHSEGGEPHAGDGDGSGVEEHQRRKKAKGIRVLRWLRVSDQWFEKQARRYWAFVVSLCLFLAGILGSVTFMRLGYLALLSLALLLFELGRHGLLRRVWYMVLLYAGVVLVVKYMYQFPDLRRRLHRYVSGDVISDAGFRVMDSQRELFVYLLPATLTLVAAVIQTRVQTLDRTLFEGRLLPSRTWLQKLLVGTLRLLWLQIDTALLTIALASALQPTPEGMDIVTVLFIGLIMLIPKSKRVLYFLLLGWMLAMALAKLAYQLREVHIDVKTAEITWFGLRSIRGTRTTPLALVQWEIYVVLCCLVRRILRDMRSRLWSDDGGRGQRCFFDEPPPRPQSIERMAESLSTASSEDAEHVPLHDSTSVTPRMSTSSLSSSTVAHLRKPQPWTVESVLLAFRFVVNHYFELFGMYLVLVLALVAALVRLNAASLFYLVVVGILATRRNTISHFAWRTILIIQTVLFLYLYAGSLGLPTTIAYPWDDVASRHESVRVLLRWIFLPPTHGGSSSHSEPNNGVIPRAPPSWSSPEVLYVDFFFLLFGGMQLPLRTNSYRTKFSKRYATMMANLSPLSDSIKRTLVWTLPWVCLLLILVIPLARRSALTLVYLGQGFYLLIKYIDFYTRVRRAKRFWRRFLWFAYALITLHVVWVLPALLVDWSHAPTALIDFVQFMGFRHGMNAKLLPSDPRVSAWAAGSGLLFDVLLFLSILPLLYLLDDSSAARAATDFADRIKNAKTKAKLLAPRLKAKIMRQKEQTAQRVELAKQFIQRLSEYKREDTAHGFHDRELALWFLRRRDASALLAQSLTAPETAGVTSTAEDRGGGSGARSNESKGEGPGGDNGGAIATAVDVTSDEEEEVALATRPPEEREDGSTAIAVSGAEIHHTRGVDSSHAADTACASSAADDGGAYNGGDQVNEDQGECKDAKRDEKKPPLMTRMKQWLRVLWRSCTTALCQRLREANDVFRPLWQDETEPEAEMRESPRFIDEEPVADGSDLLTELRRFCSTHTHIPCYVLLIVNVLVESSFLAVLLPLFYFLLGGLVRPFPSILFWNILTVYSITTISLKLVFQFKFWGDFNEPAAYGSECYQSFFNDGCMTFPRFLGIWRYTDSPKFLVDLFPDVLLLIALFVHRVNLRSLGMWQHRIWPDMSESKREDDDTAAATDDAAETRSTNTTATTTTADATNTATTTTGDDHAAATARSTAVSFRPSGGRHLQAGADTTSLRSRRVGSTASAGSAVSARSHHRGKGKKRTDGHRRRPSLLSRLKKGVRDILDDSLAAPRDYYIPSFLVEFVSLVVICFGWSGFRRREQYAISTASIIQDNNIPSGLLLYMLMQFLFIIIDRALYLTRNVRGKLVFHCLVALLVHFLVFYWIPATTRRSFRENGVIILLYLLKVVYLFLSAAQIQATFPLSVQRNALTHRSTTFSFVVFQVYKAIPFMHELRMLLDWSCTMTTLQLDDWYRVEDINGQLFANQHTIKSEKKAGRKWGEKQPLMRKLLTGVSLVAVLIIVLWFPLLIMSLVNERAEPNVPNRVEISLSVNSFQPLFVMDTVPGEPSIASEDLTQLTSLDPTGFVSSFRQSDVQRVLLSPQSKAVWTISPSSRARLVTTLQDNSTDVVLEFTARFVRDVREGVAQTSSDTRVTRFSASSPQRQQLLDAFNDSRSRVHLTTVFPSTYHLTHQDMPQPLSALPSTLQHLTANCTLFREVEGEREWWTLLQSSEHVATTTDDRNISHSSYPASKWLEIITLNDRVIPDNLSFISSYGIVGLYVSVVLVIGRFIRLSVDNVSHNIIFEKMPQVLAVRSVLDALYLSREHGEMWTEESIFHLLLRLYRSPEALLVWTDESLLQQRHHTDH